MIGTALYMLHGGLVIFGAVVTVGLLCFQVAMIIKHIVAMWHD